MALLTLGARCSLLTRVMAGIDTTTLAAFYNSVRVTEGENQGALRAHDDGEVDTRTVYCAVAVCAALKMPLQPLFEGTGAWLARCQTYEGGVGAEPHNEAHGGYSYCGLAAALLLGEAHRLDLDALLQWMALRQLGKEGGFNGRANKLVDSCYSLWVGGMFPLLHAAKRAVAMRHAGNVQQQQQQQQQQQGPASRTALDVGVGLSPHPHLQDRHAALMACVLPPPRLGWLFDQRALQQYVTLTCQGAVATSGIRDKPGKFPDFYHTCYALSGLSVAQMSCAPKFSKEELEKEREADGSDDADSDVISVFNMDQYRELNPHILGGASNRLLITNPAYNLTTGVVDAVNSYFAEKDAFASSDESE
jgi:protein farnesyltransferase subunit beta